jgi:hypothetical protein
MTCRLQQHPNDDSHIIAVLDDEHLHGDHRPIGCAFTFAASSRWYGTRDWAAPKLT